MMPRIVRSRPELIAALRERVAAIGVTRLTVDAITGLPDGYSAKLLAPQPIRGLGPQSLRLLLDALGLGIAAVVLVEDAEQAARMAPRWTPRKRKNRPAEPELPFVCVAEISAAYPNAAIADPESMMAGPSNRLMIGLDPRERDRIEEIARAEQRSVANAARKLIVEALEHRDSATRVEIGKVA